MKTVEDFEQELAALQGRLSKLSEASIRINQTLDLDTVLQGVLDSARALTEARYGVIALLEDAGQPQLFLSSGLTSEEAEQLWNVPHGMQIFEYLCKAPAPFRLEDLHSHMKSAGLPDLQLPMLVGSRVSFLAAPLVHRSQRAGGIYLADKEGGLEFTSEDEEALIMFASQAALVILNTRRYREEQRARNDLETLMNTAPVAVLVFDASTGKAASVNREAKRLLDVLYQPGGSLEDFMKVATIRHADGREIPLEELPLAKALSAGETVRAEEVVVEAPDGKSLTLLVNATPIRSEEGEVESVVVALQDMTPLEELERLRAQFLGMVSHELRTPLTSIKGSADTLLESSSELGSAEMRQFFQIIRDQSDNMRYLISDLLDVARIETGELSVTPEPLDVASLVDEARNRFLSGGGRSNLHINLPPDLPPVMAERRRIVQVLNNLLTNASRHSQESSLIRVAAVRDGVYVALSVADEGEGIPPERMPHLFRKFSRLDGENWGTDLGGSGLGLAICRGIVEAHGGRIWAESEGQGLGSRFTFTIPVAEEVPTLAAPAPPWQHHTGRERTRVLAVDDDPLVLRYIRDSLARMGYDPIVTGEPKDVLRMVEEDTPHLILLDLVLPGTDGIALMQDILELTSVPVIFLSVYGQEEVIARAFDMGAADYVVKPFSPTELAARIRAALRKRTAPEPAPPSEPHVLGDLTIDYSQRNVTIAGRPVMLTDIEYRVLVELMLHGSRVLTHDQLLQRVWGPGRSSDSGPVRTIIKRLRHKLNDDADAPTYIVTEPRVGYRMAAAPERAEPPDRL